MGIEIFNELITEVIDSVKEINRMILILNLKEKKNIKKNRLVFGNTIFPFIFAHR